MKQLQKIKLLIFRIVSLTRDYDWLRGFQTITLSCTVNICSLRMDEYLFSKSLTLL